MYGSIENWDNQSNLDKEEQSGDTMLTDGKVCYKTVVNNTVWFGIKTHIHNGTK